MGKRGKYGIEGDIDDVKDFFKNDAIEEVPQNDLSLIKNKKEDEDLPEGYSSMDSDDIAETRALAKKMLRKTNKNNIAAIPGSLPHRQLRNSLSLA